VDVRVLAAANETLEKALAEGTFRQDLYYRLNQLRIDLPPLRDRPEDIRPLVTHFLDPLFDRYEVVVSEELIQAMQAFDWPGNVRQLKHAVSRMALMAGDRRVLGADLFDAGRPKQKPDSPAASPAPEKQSDALGPPPRSHDTLQRRRYVTDMFRKHRKLTRAQIIRQVGCAPNTATRDLQHFQQEGLIRRVETSGHLRTSYFQWIGSDGQA
jgi:transcriptional regulator with PAS, ATPase and Fis domain